MVDVPSQSLQRNAGVMRRDHTIPCRPEQLVSRFELSC